MLLSDARAAQTRILCRSTAGKQASHADGRRSAVFRGPCTPGITRASLVTACFLLQLRGATAARGTGMAQVSPLRARIILAKTYAPILGAQRRST